MTASRTPRKTSATFLLAIVLAAVIAALVFFLALPTRRRPAPAPPPDPFGPIRSIADIKRDAATTRFAGTPTGQAVRVRGRLTNLRDLNPGQFFPWDVVYTVDDGTGTLPVHWFVQEQRPGGVKPDTLPGDMVIVTGKLKRNVELEGKTYPLLIHEQPELHDVEHPTLPASPVAR
jgi:hypothetical protein